MKPWNTHFKGQALVEYLFILIFAISVGLKFVQAFSDFFGGSTGNLAHVLSTNLTVGVCASDCFYEGYDNGYKGGK